jgi:hypothetical protein
VRNVSRTDISLGVQLSNVVCILAITGGVIAAGIKLLEGVPLFDGLVILGSLALAGVSYVVCVKRKMIKLSIAICYFFGCMVCIPYTFLVGGGVTSGLTAYFVLAIVLTFYMFQDRAWIVPVALEIIIFLGCIAVSYYSPPDHKGLQIAGGTAYR